MEFLKDIWQHPSSTIIERYSRLALSARRGTGLQKCLWNRGLIISSPIAIGHARIKVLSLTGPGKAVLGIDEPDTDRLGGPEHRYWKHRVAEHLASCGYTVEQEVPIGGGKTVDLVAARDGERIAFEIETGKSDAAANVSKCLDAGMNEVIVVATSVQAKHAIANTLRRHPDVSVLSAVETIQRKSW